MGAAVLETASPVYVTMTEYAAALEGKVIELKTVAEKQLVMTNTTDIFSASATTTEMAGMRTVEKANTTD